MKRESVLLYIQKSAHLLTLFLFGLALFIFHSELKTHHFDHILQSVRGVPARILIAAVALTVLNYLVLAGYDLLALRYTGHGQIPVTKVLAASLISYAISNNTGHAWAAGGSVRAI